MAGVVGRGGAWGAAALFTVPKPVLKRLAGRSVTARGRRLHLEMRVLLRVLNTFNPSVEYLSTSAGRRLYRAQTMAGGGVQQVGAVTERQIDGPAGTIDLRFYTPAGMAEDSAALMYLHGGEFMFGDLDSHDAVCRFFAEEAQVRVVAVNYRLAPEHPFPGGLEDCLAAWSWLCRNAEALGIDTARLAIGGDGAGATLATVVAAESRHTGACAPVFQMLIYPITDFAEKRPSHEEFGANLHLTAGFIDRMHEDLLVGDEDLKDPRLSPLHGDLVGLPDAHIVTAGFDPLVDEGEEYARRLTDAGVFVDYVCEDELVHGFINMIGASAEARRAAGRAARALQRGLTFACPSSHRSA